MYLSLAAGGGVGIAMIAPLLAVEAPVFAPGAATLPIGYEVAVSSSTPGAVIHYTTNGADPTLFDPLLGGGNVVVKRNLTLKARAWLGTDSSAVTTADYSVTGEVTAGAAHVLALQDAGGVLAWGLQTNGRLGNGQTGAANISTPAEVRKNASTIFTGALAIAGGKEHSVALVPYTGNTTQVLAFGLNSNGQLGNNSTTQQAYPVATLKSAVVNDYLLACSEVAAGEGFSAALANDGCIYTWGNRANGQLGDGGSSDNRLFAAKVKKSDAGNPDLNGITRLDLGETYGAARDSNGHVWVWGDNSSGQLGVGNTNVQPYATRVKLDATLINGQPNYLTDAIDVSAGDDHTAVVRWKDSDPDMHGTVWTFGSRTNGRLGNNNVGGTTGSQTYPVRVVKADGSPLNHIVQVSAGSAHTLALDQDGEIWAWGYNGTGALGDNTTTQRPYAVQVKKYDDTNPNMIPSPESLQRKFAYVAAGGATTANFSVAIDTTGKVFTCGSNNNGQMGRGTTDTAPHPLLLVVNNLKLTVNAPNVTLSASVTDAEDPGVATLDASPTDADGIGNIQKVEFFSQGNLIGTATAAPWSVSLPNLAAGSYHNYAIVTDANGNAGMSMPVQFSIDVNPDADDDGLLDSWEITSFGNLGQTANGDPDGDHISNADERSRGTNPIAATDSDSDGLPDDWEMFWFGNLNQTQDQDGDGDGLANFQEFLLGLNPLSATTQAGQQDSALDRDGDGMPDAWEAKWAAWVWDNVLQHNVWIKTLDWEVSDASADFDNDGFSNFTEIGVGYNPTLADTDGDSDWDGIPDVWEWNHGLDPYAYDSYLDNDQDGLTNLDEFLLGLDPQDPTTNGMTPDGLADRDGDGMPDAWEAKWAVYEWDATLQMMVWRRTLDWGVADANGDFDQDGLSNLAEYNVDTDPTQADSDGDHMPDGWEIANQFNPHLVDADDDADNDGVTNVLEYLLGFDPHNATSNGGISDPTADRDDDGMLDAWEAKYGNWRYDAALQQEIFQRSLDWDVADASGDFDHDGVNNLAEYNAGTNPTQADSDRDGMPDGWEMQFGLNPLDNSGVNGTQGDSDGDGLFNFDEWLNGTSPQIADSDGDGVNDFNEVANGSDPNNNADHGHAPASYKMIEVPFSVGDPSGSHSEKWKMTIRALGPDDTRTICLTSPDYGEMAEQTIKLWKWNRYEISVDHLSTDPVQLLMQGAPDYDWTATVGSLPGGVSEEHTTTTTGVNNYYMVSNHWLVENPKAVFTQEKHGDDVDLVTGKKSYLVPVKIKDKDFATGVDDVSKTAIETDIGYQSQFWVMAPIDEQANSMRFKIPLQEPAVLNIQPSSFFSYDPSTLAINLTNELLVSWTGLGAVSQDSFPMYNLGPAQTLVGLPIAVKTMKRRTAKLTVYAVRASPNDPQVALPVKVDLIQYLNEVYGNQINAWFDTTSVSYKQKNQSGDFYDYGSSNGFVLEYGSDAFNGLLNAYNDPEADITIVAVSKGKLGKPNANVLGMTEVSKKMCVVILTEPKNIFGDNNETTIVDSPRNQNDVIHAIAHEIGHVMIGEGHPDKEPTPQQLAQFPHLAGDGGPAPLKGTDTFSRLMNSGTLIAPTMNCKLLVKTEWDRMESWLKKNIEKSNP